MVLLINIANILFIIFNVFYFFISGIFTARRHGIVHLISQFHGSLSWVYCGVRIERSVNIYCDFCPEKVFLISYGKRKCRAVIYYRITEGALVKRTNSRVIRPDMCLGVNKNRVSRADVVLKLPKEIFHAPELIRYRKGAQHLHDIFCAIEGDIVRMCQYDGFPREAYACRNVTITRNLGMISIEKCRPAPAITAIP